MNKACSRRDELADDDVLFQAEERVGGGADCRACQHLDRVLEGGGGEERVGAEGCLGDAEQNFLRARRLLAFCQQRFVDLADFEAVHCVAGQIFGIAGASDLHLAQHLADDDFKMLVVDVLTL